MKLKDAAFAVVDVETTGSNPDQNRIMEIGAVKITGRKIVDTFHSLVNPGQPIPFFVSWMTGISGRILKASPPFGHIAQELQIFLNNTVFVAHDARFDYEFIKTEFLRAGLTAFYQPTLCTIKLARRIFPGFTKYNLRDLSSNLGIPIENPHRAFPDCLAAAKILLLIFERLEATGFDDLRDLERICQLSPQECSELFSRSFFRKPRPQKAFSLTS